MKIKLYTTILKFEQWRLNRKKNRLLKELKETNEQLVDLDKVLKFWCGGISMTENTKIKYVFHNKHSETVDMTFTMLQIEGMTGGFINHVLKLLDEMGFGKPTEIYRMMVL